MGKIIIGAISVILLVGIYVHSKLQVEPLRNKIVFEDDVNVVLDSLQKMNELMEKMPTNTRMVNYFMDREGYLYLGAEKIALLKGAINKPKVREDMAFENFTDKEINEFFYLMAFLLKNHVDAANLEKPIDKFLFSYRRTDENSYNDLRDIMIVGSPYDTTTRYFKETYQVLDENLNLVLVAPSDASIE